LLGSHQREASALNLASSAESALTGLVVEVMAARKKKPGNVFARLHSTHSEMDFARAARGPPVDAMQDYCERVPTTSISTRRVCARPAAVLLVATGWSSPLPSV